MKASKNKLHFFTIRFLFIVLAFIFFNTSLDFSTNSSQKNFIPKTQQLGEAQINSFVEMFLEIGFDICDASIHQNTESQERNIAKKINFQFNISEQTALKIDWELLPEKITHKNINPRLIGLSREINTPPPQC